MELEAVNVAVLYAKRMDGIKFSIRSEDPDVHAGELAEIALEKLGSGGGHAFMAGGIIRKEQEKLLGENPDVVIREAFLHVIDQMKKK